MNMKNAFKFIGVSAFALALVFSGCGKGRKSSSESDSKYNMVQIKEETSEMSLWGFKLFKGIMLANVERQGASADTVWPRTKVEGDRVGGTDDIANNAFRSATDYFSVLFDMEHYGTSEWDPYVDGELLSALGKDAVSGKTIRAAGLDWCIAANVAWETESFMPVLISANFNPKLLAPGRFDGRDDTPLPIGPESGAAKSMFGDQAIVVVRMSGAAEVIMKKDLTRARLYNNQSFDYSGSEKIPIMYLTPTGVVEPVGHE